MEIKEQTAAIFAVLGIILAMSDGTLFPFINIIGIFIVGVVAVKMQ
jgi:hypothetical protein